MQCTHNVTMWRVRVTTVAVDTQQFVCVCVCVCVCVVVVVVELHDTVNFANARGGAGVLKTTCSNSFRQRTV